MKKKNSFLKQPTGKLAGFCSLIRQPKHFIPIIISLILAVALTAGFFWQLGQAVSVTVDTLTDEQDNSCADDCSLRDAVATAQPGDTIVFGINGTITLTLGEIVINKDLTIIGAGQDKLTISGNNASRIFVVESGNVSLLDMTITSGLANTSKVAVPYVGKVGGGIYNNATLTVRNVTFVNNNAESFGGAIYNYLNASLTVNSCTFSGNSGAEGGAIGNSSTLNISDSTFTANKALHGGAIMSNLGSITISDSFFSDNVTLARFGYGGAIRLSSGYGGISSLSIMRSMFTNNKATGFGGAIENHGDSTFISASKFYSNAASYGGAIRSYTALDVENSLCRQNTATDNGGCLDVSSGTVNLSNNTFSENSSGNEGGAIFSGNGIFTITNNTFGGNSAGSGGGIRLYDQAKATITNNIIADSPTGRNCAISGSVITSGSNNYETDGSCSANYPSYFTQVPSDGGPSGLNLTWNPQTESYTFNCPTPVPCDAGAAPPATPTPAWTETPTFTSTFTPTETPTPTPTPIPRPQLTYLSKPIYRDGAVVSATFANVSDVSESHLVLKDTAGNWVRINNVNVLPDFSAPITNSSLYQKDAGFYLHVKDSQGDLYFGDNVVSANEAEAQASTYKFSTATVPLEYFDPNNITAVDVVVGSWQSFAMSSVEGGGWERTVNFPNEFTPNFDAGYYFKLTDNQNRIIYVGGNNIYLNEDEARSNPISYMILVNSTTGSFYADAAKLQQMMEIQPIDVRFTFNVPPETQQPSYAVGGFGGYTGILESGGYCENCWGLTSWTASGEVPNVPSYVIVVTNEAGQTLYYISGGVIYFSLNQIPSPPVDNIPPETTHDYSGPACNLMLNLTASDSGSGVQSISYTVSDGRSGTVYGSSLTLKFEQEGDFTVAYFAKDAAGNTEEQKSVEVRNICPTPTPTDTPTFSPTPTNATIHILTDYHYFAQVDGKWKPVWGPLIHTDEAPYVVELYDYNQIKADYKSCLAEDRDDVPDDEEENCIKPNDYLNIRKYYKPLQIQYPTTVVERHGKQYSDAVFQVWAKPKGSPHPHSKFLALGIYDDESFHGKGNLLARTIHIHEGETKYRKMHVSLIDNFIHPTSTPTSAVSPSATPTPTVKPPKPPCSGKCSCVPLKMTTVHGSGELDIYEPEYVPEEVVIYYPYDFEARDNWDVTITIQAPAGYTADRESETLTIPPQAIEATTFVLTATDETSVQNGLVKAARAAEISAKSISSTVRYTNKNSGKTGELVSMVPVVKAQAPTPVPTPEEKVLGLPAPWGWTVFGVIVAACLALLTWMILVIVRAKPKK